MQGSPSGKLEVAFVANNSTQKVVANMEVDREYNACKALDPQIDNEDDVQHSSPHYEINEQELQMQMGLGGLYGCNDWVGQTGRSELVAALYGRGGLADGRVRKLGPTGLGRTGADWGGLGGLGRTGRTGADEENGAEGGVLGRAWRGVRGGLGITPGQPYHSLACRGDSRSAKSGCGLWGHLAPYTADPHQILRCSCRRPLLGDSHFEGAKTLYQ